MQDIKQVCKSKKRTTNKKYKKKEKKEEKDRKQINIKINSQHTSPLYFYCVSTGCLDYYIHISDPNDTLFSIKYSNPVHFALKLFGLLYFFSDNILR